ncbi:MAG: hypothetical protein JWO33_825, partial [Caulobacteraceae bacterium]|nr:hypothetical protein [Caulobacteraceae bacterium]
ERQGGAGAGGGRPGGAPFTAPRIAKAGAGWSASSTCKREFGETSMTIVTRESVTGDLQSKYTLKSTRTVSGAPRPEMNRATTTTDEAAYKGACTAGQKGGDLTAYGRTVNLLAGGGRGGGG